MSTAWVKSASASSSSPSSPGRPPPLPSRRGAVISGRYCGPPCPRQWRASCLDLRIGHEHALQADRAWRVDRLVEHVARARAGPRRRSCRGSFESRSRRSSRTRSGCGMFALIRPVMTWTDGRWVATTRWMPVAARELRDPGDRGLDLVGADHHQVGQLVDDDDDVRHPGLARPQRLVVSGDVADAAARRTRRIGSPSCRPSTSAR